MAGTYVNRGVLHMAVDEYAAARSATSRKASLDPSLGEACVNLGGVEIAQRQFADGIADIDKGLALGAAEPEKAYYNRALADEGWTT